MNEMINKYKKVFIVGAPRSGTTWMQLLLSQFDEVATSQETHLFNNYVNNIEKCWATGLKDHRNTGLHNAISESFISNWVKTLCDNTLTGIANNNPTASIIVEKTPKHIYCINHILKYYPDAMFIHVVRDPRSVVNSQKKTGYIWKNSWHYKTILQSSNVWNTSVSNYLFYSKKFPGNFIETSYEELYDNGIDELRRIAEFIGIKADRIEHERVYNRMSFNNIKSGNITTNKIWDLSSEPDCFFRKGIKKSWQQELNTLTLFEIESTCKKLMLYYDYKPVIRKYYYFFLMPAVWLKHISQYFQAVFKKIIS